MDKYIRILIVGDHAIVKEELIKLLEQEKDFSVIAIANHGEEAVQTALKLKPDILLLDVSMSIKNAFVSLKEMKDRDPSFRIILLTLHQEPKYLFQALHLGADGFLQKDAEIPQLFDAIRIVYQGEPYVQPSMVKELIKAFRDHTKTQKTQAAPSLLTAREIEVLSLIAKGMLNKEIAKSLFISEKTVKNHISSLFRKLDVSDRTQAAIFALKHHLV